MTKYVDIRIEFSEVEDGDYSYLDLAAVRHMEDNLDDGDAQGIAETLCQSDFGSIEFPNAIIDAIQGESTRFKR